MLLPATHVHAAPSIEEEALEAVYGRLPATLAVSCINAALIVVVLEDEGLSRGPFAWFALVTIVALARAWVYIRYRGDAERHAHSAYWARASVVGALFAGALWGVGPLLQLGHGTAEQWLWAFAIGGMCAGAASLHAAHLPTTLSFIYPAAVPLAISLLLQGTLAGTAAAVMTIAFIGLTTATAILFNRDFRRVRDLRSAVQAHAAEVDDTNRRLSKEMADHKSTADALHQSQKMEALGNLTGGFAHDFNNILMVIIGNLEMIGRGPLTPQGTELANLAIGAAESGSELISRLLAFARKQTLAPEYCDVVETVRNFQPLLNHAVSSNIRVEFVFAVPSVMAKFDISQFQAMLLNLVVNARDAMPDGGVATVSVGADWLDERALRGTTIPPGPFVAISVADTGMGMQPDTRERAFEPFFTTKGERGGTGLGLAQVYGFARQSGGLGHIESTPGTGTRVTVFVPAQEADLVAVADIRPVDIEAEVVPAYSVLLVDDNISVLNALETSLKEEGWPVHSVTGSGLAIEALESGRRFDIVVTDVNMPGGMNGEQMAREIRERFSLPVLLMSGAPDFGLAQAQGLSVIAKPFRKAVLLAKIRDVVGAHELSRKPHGEGEL